MDEGTKDKWYLTLNYSETKDIIQEKLQNMSRDFVAIGYYLKWIRDNELYKQDGYSSIWEFAEDNYGIKRTTASRWMAMNDKFSEGGNTPILAKEFRMFGKSQLQEMLYLDDKQMEEVSPDMTVQEIREVRKPEPEEGPISILGYPLRVYPEDSLIKTPGCGKQDCFSCHRDGCELRQEDCYCVEAPMGNPFPCTTLNVVENLRQDIGSKCQFVNEDLAFHRAGDGQPVPCCKECNHPCGYECNRSVRARHDEAKKNMCDVARDEAIEEKHGTAIDELNFSVRTYNVLKRAGVETIEEIQSMSDVDLAMIRNFSRRCMDEVHSKLEEYARNNAEKLACDVAHESEEQIPGQMSVEDCPELLPDQDKTDIDINNVEDNDVIKQPENVINQSEPVTEDDENVIDTECKEIAAENAETEEICCKEAADLDELTFSQIAILDYLEEEEQTLAEYEKVNSEDGGLPLNLMMRQRMLVKALRLLMENEADQDEQEDEDEPEEQEEHATVQPDLPAMKNNDQRKEWLKNYKEWGLWYRDENIDVNYYKYDFSDGSRLVVAEYPKRRRYWNTKELADEHYYHLLEKNREYYGCKERYDHPYTHSTDSETYLVEFLKNLQKGEKK